MRALALIAAATLALGGCHKVRSCKAGTVLLSVDVPAGADTLDIVVTIDGAASAPQPVTLAKRGVHGTVELDFATYPGGHMVSVAVTALGGGTALGSGTSPPRTLANGCDSITLTVAALGDGGVGADLLGADLLGTGGSCTSTTDCPMGQSCDTTNGSCTTSCSSAQPCNGGCCDGTTCAVGDTGTACALGQVSCGSCAGSSAGNACTNFGGANVCGCLSAGDCPANQACNTTTHTCGATCDSDTPCNGGCCSAMTGGTCQTGTAKTVCGNNGSVCGDCTANQNGHVCTVVTGGGQCGCANVASDCPGASTACTAGLCVNSCSSTMACLSGCCSDATMGTCQPGTSQAVCGAPGSLCSTCVGNANGSACLSSGACGCTSANDCPLNFACDATLHKCTTSCNVNQACHGGCCSSAGTCAAGNAVSSCGSAGTTCAVCPTNAACATYSCNGTTCVTSYVTGGTQCIAPDPENCRSGAYCSGSSASCPATVGCQGGACCMNASCVQPCP
jgi:hypothetical protein